MSGMSGRNGRKTFVPTSEQGNNIKVLAGLRMPKEQDLSAGDQPQTGKPFDEKSLRKHFKREIATWEIELHARVGNFIVADILGMASPVGTVAIDNQHVRRLARAFLPRPGCGGRHVRRPRSNPDDNNDGD
jgi:hypothetical protein